MTPIKVQHDHADLSQTIPQNTRLTPVSLIDQIAAINRAITVPELSKLLRLGRTAIYDLVKRHAIPIFESATAYGLTRRASQSGSGASPPPRFLGSRSAKCRILCWSERWRFLPVLIPQVQSRHFSAPRCKNRCGLR